MLMLTFANGRRLRYDPQYVKYWAGRDTLAAPEVTHPGLIEKVCSGPEFDLPNRISQPTVVTIVLGYKCNFVCDYCSQRETRLAGGPIGSLDDMFHLLRQYPQRFHNMHTLLFWGGEPLLYWYELTSILDHILANGLHAKDFHAVIVTNGSLLTREMARYIKRHPSIRVTLSHDGPAIPRNRQVDVLDKGHPAYPELIDLYRFSAVEDHATRKLQINPTTIAFAEVNEHLRRVFKGFVPVTGLGTYFVNSKNSAMASPYLQDPAGSALKVWEGLRGGHCDHYWGLFNAKFSHYLRIARQNYNFLDTYENSAEVSPRFRIRINLRGDITACHVGNFNPGYTLGHVADLDDIRKQTFPYLGIFTKDKREVCEDCPVLTFCQTGDPFVTDIALMERNCHSRFIQFFPIWMHVLHGLTGGKLTRVDGEFHMRSLAECLLDRIRSSKL